MWNWWIRRLGVVLSMASVVDSPTGALEWAPSYAADIIFEASWAPKPREVASSVEGNLVSPFSRDDIRCPVEVLVAEEARTDVNGQVLRRGNIYAASQAREVQSMFFNIVWNAHICSGIPRDVLRLPTYAINSASYTDGGRDILQCRISDAALRMCECVAVMARWLSVLKRCDALSVFNQL